LQWGLNNFDYNFIYIYTKTVEKKYRKKKQGTRKKHILHNCTDVVLVNNVENASLTILPTGPTCPGGP